MSHSLFKNQDYTKIKNECLKSKKLFCDDVFNLDVPHATWLRPKDIIKDPEFLVEGASRLEVVQGANQGSWLVQAMAGLTMNTGLFRHVVPTPQSFIEDYAGVFRFNIWQFGKWVEVVVDDRLPTKDGKLMFVQSTQKKEFWSPLLEKAYAKLHGSYDELTLGWFSEAIVDFTGGVVEEVELTSTQENLETIISSSFEHISFMCVFMFDDPLEKGMTKLDGLVKGNAYSINKALTLTPPNSTDSILLVKLRNPWGETEWKGAWSESSPEWKSIPIEERKKLGLVSENDGEFWMSLKDLSRYFEHVSICHLSPDIFNNLYDDVKVGWESNGFRGEWITNLTAGGFYLETFHLNPQYRITLTDDSDEEDKLCTVIVALMQRNKTRQVWHRIGFTIFYLEGSEKLSTKSLSKNYIQQNFTNSLSSKFREHRENVVRGTWAPGVYCIIPSTYKPNEEGQFFLRVYSEKCVEMEESEISEEVSEPIVLKESPEPKKPIQDRANTRKITEKRLLKRTDQELSEFFHKVAGPKSEIGWQELQAVLNYALNDDQISDTVYSDVYSRAMASIGLGLSRIPFYGASENKIFSKDECRNMIAVLDDDVSGTLRFEEFQMLMKKLRSWESVFLNHSTESDHIGVTELHKALREIGYHVKNSDLSKLVRIYSDDHGNIAFDDFIMCVIRIMKNGIS